MRLLVSVGTDHHRFDRLVSWIDAYVAARPGVSALVQRGSSRSSERAESRPLIPHDELLELFAAASAVVCHGGPATVMDARRAGHRPIVVPRDPSFDEHVDGHQLRFARHLESEGLATVATTEAELFTALDRIVEDPASAFTDEVLPEFPPGIVEFGAVVDDLLGIETPLTEP